MNFIPFLLGLICIEGLALILSRVNWKVELFDMVQLFKKKVRDTPGK